MKLVAVARRAWDVFGIEKVPERTRACWVVELYVWARESFFELSFECAAFLFEEGTRLCETCLSLARSKRCAGL